MDQLQDRFDAEDAAGKARKRAAIKELAEKIFISMATRPNQNIANDISVSYCLAAAKVFIEYEGKS